MNLPKIIAIAAPSRRSGKGTAADVLTSGFGYVQFNFALPIKTMFTALMMHSEVPQSLYPRILEGDMKETPLAQVGGLSLRTFAEGVGTTWGRDIVDRDLWVNIARAKIVPMLAQGKRLVIEDARFPNECDLIRDLGGKVLYITRPVYNGGLEPTLASEGHLKDYRFDFIIANDAGVDRFQTKVRDWIMRVSEETAA